MSRNRSQPPIRRLGLWLLLAAAQLVVMPTMAAAQKPTAIDRWLNELESPHFVVRQRAASRLMQAGPNAISPLTEFIATAGLDSSVRGLAILRELALINHFSAADAERAINQLAASEATATSFRAAETLASLQLVRPARGRRLLMRLGAQFTAVGETADERQLGAGVLYVKLGNAWKGQLDDLTLLSWLGDNLGLHVTLEGKSFNDRTLDRLAQLPNLVSLRISRTNVGDQGLAAVPKMANLRNLSLRNSRSISDAALKFVQPHTRLQSLSVFGTAISKPAFDTLAQQKPQWSTRFGRGGYLGISGDAFATNETRGCIVLSVIAGEAAEQAGLREGDVITHFDGQTVVEFIPPVIRGRFRMITPNLPAPRPANPEPDEEPTDADTGPSLSELIGQHLPGDRVPIKVLRENEQLALHVVLGEWP